MRRIAVAVMMMVACASAVACSSNADTASDNISKEAERFRVQRKIVGINGITDKVLFYVEGKCSLENGDSMAGFVDVICKHGPNDYRKHYIAMSDNVTIVSTQVKGIDVSEYRTKFIIRPQSIVPDIDIMTGE